MVSVSFVDVVDVIVWVSVKVMACVWVMVTVSIASQLLQETTNSSIIINAVIDNENILVVLFLYNIIT
jgi:hypothetical protein